MTLSKREKLGMFALALVVIGLVLFFTVGRSKENYSPRNKETYWADKAYRLPFASIEEKEAAKKKVDKAPNQERKYQQVRRNLLIALIRTENRKAKAQGKETSQKAEKLKIKLKKLNVKLGR